MQLQKGEFMTLTLASHGHRVSAPMQHRSAPPTTYTVLKINTSSQRVLLEPNNDSLAIWFDAAAVLVAFEVGQVLTVEDLAK